MILGHSFCRPARFIILFLIHDLNNEILRNAALILLFLSFFFLISPNIRSFWLSNPFAVICFTPNEVFVPYLKRV